MSQTNLTFATGVSLGIAITSSLSAALYALSKQFSMAIVIETLRQSALAEFMCWALAMEFKQMKAASNTSQSGQERTRVTMRAQ